MSRPTRCWCRSSTCSRRANGTFIANTRAAREASVETDILSAFGQLTYKFTDQFRVNVGGRVTHEEKDGERTLTIESLDGAPLTGHAGHWRAVGLRQFAPDQLDQPDHGRRNADSCKRRGRPGRC